MEIINKITFDMAAAGMPPYIDAVQGDALTRKVEVTLMTRGQVFDPSDGFVSVSVAFKKPDGTAGWYDTLPDGNIATTVISDGVYQVSLAPEMFTVPGSVYALFRFDLDGKTISTFPFFVRVSENPSFNSSKSENYYNVQTWDAVNASFDEIFDRLSKLESGDIGGGTAANLLTVTTEQSDPDMWVASHGAQEIYAHIQSGGLVVLVHNGLYYSLSTVSEGIAVFSWYDASQERLENYILYNDRELYHEATDIPSGGGSVDAVPLVAPRAQVRQLKHYIEADSQTIMFEDVYALCDNGSPHIANRCRYIYALEAHGVSSTTQRVFKSVDGETWSVLATLPINATNGVWYTDLFVQKTSPKAVETLILLKTTNGFYQTQNKLCSAVWNGSEYYVAERLDLGNRRWLSNNASIDECVNAAWTERAIIFGEYATTTDGTSYSLLKSTDNGATWKKVLELNGDSGGTALNGEIRHWHAVQCDPWNKGHWWASSGDGNASASNPNGQCRIYRSTDMGETWELMFSGSQRERTCGFVFEQDCIYYGMDSTNNTDENSIKIVKIDRSKLETDRANCREDVAVVGNAFAVYGMTRTFYPDGLIVWTQQEPNASYTPGRYILQFYDYATKKMYPIAYFDTSSIANSEYIGFFAGAKTQHCESGVIIAKPTRPLHQAKYGDSYVSTHIGLNLTM